MPTNCMHCDNPPCVKAAPAGALTKRPDGIVAVDYEKIKGKDVFERVSKACPYGAFSYDANSRRDKEPELLRLREEVEELKVLLRLCHDVKAFPNLNSFEHAIQRVIEIAKQNERWLRSQRQGHGQSRRAMPEGVAAPGAP